jgi:hypothetical protein
MTDEELIEIGFHVESLLRSGSFEMITSKYGYALSFDRRPSEAIESDLRLAESKCEGFLKDAEVAVQIAHFTPNEEGLVSEISCDFILRRQTGILVELILNNQGDIYLEQISSYGLNTNA